MRRLAVVLALGLFACDGETPIPGAPLGWGPASGTLYEPPSAGGGILGDWFSCGDESCAQLSGQGIRFSADGTWTALSTTYYYEDQGTTAEYCLSYSTGTYSWDGATLTMRGFDYGGDLSCRVTFDGDVATVSCPPSTVLYLQRVTAQVVEPCAMPMGN